MNRPKNGDGVPQYQPFFRRQGKLNQLCGHFRSYAHWKRPSSGRKITRSGEIRQPEQPGGWVTAEDDAAWAETDSLILFKVVRAFREPVRVAVIKICKIDHISWNYYYISIGKVPVWFGMCLCTIGYGTLGWRTLSGNMIPMERWKKKHRITLQHRANGRKNVIPSSCCVCWMKEENEKGWMIFWPDILFRFNVKVFLGIEKLWGEQEP